MSTSRVGCQTCRNRRIKCDGEKPVCNRCTKSKRICIAHIDSKQTSFSMHNENVFASGRSKRPRGPRSSYVSRQPTIDLETQALAYYSQYHLNIIPDGPITTGGLPECVAAWKAAGNVDPMVDLALSSMALAVYANVSHEPTAATKASSRYDELLRLVQERITQVELSTPSEEALDACLLSIFLMSRYETTTHLSRNSGWNEPLHAFQRWSHHEGAMTMLKVWHDKPDRGCASNIVKETRRGQIRSVLLRSRVLPEWLHDGAIFGETGLELDYDRIMIRIVLLRQSLVCSQQTTGTKDTRIHELDQEAQHIEGTLHDWIKQFSQTLQLQLLSQTLLHVSPVPREHFYSQTVNFFTRVGHAGLWTQYLGAYMLITTTRLKILKLGSPDLLQYCTFRESRSDCIRKMRNAADDLASIIPFCLERVKLTQNEDTVALNRDEDILPYMTRSVIWPLSIASCVDSLDEHIQIWFRQELACIGGIIGDGMLTTANTEEWTISI